MSFKTSFGMSFKSHLGGHSEHHSGRHSGRHSGCQKKLQNDRCHFSSNDEALNYNTIDKDKIKYGAINEQFSYIENHKQISFN